MSSRRGRAYTPPTPVKAVGTPMTSSWRPEPVVRRPGSSTAHLPSLAGGRLYPHWCQPR